MNPARWRLLIALLFAVGLLLVMGLATGSEGLSWAAWQQDLAAGQLEFIVGEIRAPRTLGALGVGALLGLAGAIAQGVFRNPLADPYLLGAAAGASLGVVVVLAAGAMAGHLIGLAAAAWLERVGIVAAAFAGSLGGVFLTLLLARGAQHTLRLLLAGVVVAVLLGALNDALTHLAPEALRGKQSFLLGSTAFVGWTGVGLLAIGLALALPLALRMARALDALTLGDDSARSLGLPLPKVRLLLVGLLALCTGLAVSQAGLIAFVGLVAPHVVRRLAPGPHAFLLGASALTGGVLLLAADVAARALLAPQELPVGILTGVLGGSYLVWLLNRRGWS
ncbi:MAG: FecCD family ABC transporter permease [Burkholderiales bacterium]|jgi:iron complex transport system permease protein